MPNITPFLFDSKQIRVTDQNGDPWFILRDLLEAMDSKTTTTAAVDSVKQGLGEGFVNNIPLQTVGGTQTLTIVASPAATYLLSRSNTDKGRELNRFIHVEVLPALQKTGSFSFRPNPYQAEMFGAVPDPIKMSRLFGSCVRMSKLAGLKGDDAILAADDLTVRSCGVSPLEMLKHPLAGGTAAKPASAPKSEPKSEPTEEPAVGAPSGSGLRSMTQCLHSVRSPLSAVVCNRSLARSGMLEDRTCETKEGPKPYRVLVGKGLEFGQNVRFRHDHVNTSPAYYLNRFPELLALIEAEIQASRPAPRETRTQRPNAPEEPVDIETARALLDGLGGANKMSKRQRQLYRESGLQAEKAEHRAEHREKRREEKRARIETMKAEGFEWRVVHQTLNLSKYFSTDEIAELRERFRNSKPSTKRQANPSTEPPIPPSLQIKPGETVVPFPPKVPAEQAAEFRRRANVQPVSVEEARAFMVQEAALFVADGDDWETFLYNRGHILSQVFTGAEIKSLKAAYDRVFPTGAPLVWNGLTH